MGTYGIDLGTTYSCIATLDQNGNPVVIRNQTDASDTLASALFFETADNVVVGSSAKEMVETDGDNVVQFMKRDIGKPEGRDYKFFGKTYTPVDLSALVLKRLKDMVEEQSDDTVTDVVITCPAHFGLEERNATRQAGELAGFHILDLINEPTAAALNYCARKFQEEKTILVYDLGGGTFDVTILKMSQEPNEQGEEVQKVTELATGGNVYLGGKDWDDCLFNHVLHLCCSENSLPSSEIDLETRQDIRSKVEEAKVKLTQAESTKVKVKVCGALTTVVITREDFEIMTQDKVLQTMSYVDSVLEEAQSKLGEQPLTIDTVLLVGGSTFMPMIRKAVEGKFPDIVQIEEPDRAVAMGAAIYATLLVEESYSHASRSSEGATPSSPVPSETDAPVNSETAPEVDTPKEEAPRPKLYGGIGSIQVEVQSPRSFGPGIFDENAVYMVDNLIKRGETVPASAKKTYYTLEDDMEMIVLRVFESMCLEDSIPPCLDNDGNEQYVEPFYQVKYLGELELFLPVGTAKGAPIEVSFEVTAIGVTVRAENPSTGESVEAKLNMPTDIDIQHSPVNELSVSAE